MQHIETNIEKFTGTQTVHIEKKFNLTINEAASYFNIGKNKLREMLNEPGCDFALYIGKKALIKREKFEEYLNNKIFI